MVLNNIRCISFTRSHFSQLSRYLSSHRNTPEEDDETMSKEPQEDAIVRKPDSTSKHDGLHPPTEDTTFADNSLFSRQMLHREQEHKHNPTLPEPSLSYGSYQRHHSFLAGYSQPTPFPSQAEGPWLHPSFASSCSEYPNSLPSCRSEKDYSSCFPESCHFRSLPSRPSTSVSSLEQPLSLRSNPPPANLCRHTLSPYSCSPQGAPCCAQCPADTFSRGHMANKHSWPQHHPALSPYCKFAHLQ